MLSKAEIRLEHRPQLPRFFSFLFFSFGIAPLSVRSGVVLTNFLFSSAM
jgi:hypothetical protein